MKKVRFSNIIDIKYYDSNKKVKQYNIFYKICMFIFSLLFVYLICHLCYQW